MLYVEKCGDTGTGKISFPSGFALVRNLIQMAMSMIILPLLSALVCLMLLCRVEGDETECCQKYWWQCLGIAILLLKRMRNKPLGSKHTIEWCKYLHFSILSLYYLPEILYLRLRPEMYSLEAFPKGQFCAYLCFPKCQVTIHKVCAAFSALPQGPLNATIFSHQSLSWKSYSLKSILLSNLV